MKAATAVAVLALVALCSMPTVSAQTRNYTNIIEALTGMNYTGLLGLIRLVPGLERNLSDPNLAVTMFAPNNAAVTNVQQVITTNRLNATQIVGLALPYHIIPNASVTFTDAGAYNTSLSALRPVNTTTALTTLLINNNTWYVGGIPGGAYFNRTSRITAGRSFIYPVDGVLIPPTTSLGIPLTIASLVGSSPELSILFQLVRADPAIARILSSPTTAIAVFAPTDTAFNAYFRSAGTTLAQVQGTPAASQLLLNHVIGFPYTSDDFPVGTSTGRNAANNTLTVTVTVTGRNETITIRGAGNTVAPTVISPDNIAGLSVVHAINGVILATGGNSTNTTRPPSPPAGRRLF